MKIGIAADHGGFELKQALLPTLTEAGYEIADFGAYELNTTDDYPDFVVLLAKAISSGKVERGIALCGSGVGAAIAANKIPGTRAALINDPFSAHQGVEDDDMNLICLGGRVTGNSLAKELIGIFLKARFSGAERHVRRLQKIKMLENTVNKDK